MREFIVKARENLKNIYPQKESDAIINILLEHVGINKTTRFANPSQTLTGEQTKWLYSALNRLLKHTPIQHIIGYVDFYDTKISVNKHTLIPRPETEELVDIVIAKYGDLGKLNVLDLCTGSGCIAIALAKKLKSAFVEAVDLSEDALNMATKNAIQNKVDVEFKNLDLLNAEYPDFGNKKYDIIISNPPYIPNKQRNALDKNVILHEPEMALFVPDEHPIIFYEKIALLTDKLLMDKGVLFLETHEDFAMQVVNFIDENTKLNAEVRTDLFGKKRFVISQFTS
ncbi:MAG: peptide chain release factor N(5)-glutamine methyltransferase [Bacteroidales bacterium]